MLSPPNSDNVKHYLKKEKKNIRELLSKDCYIATILYSHWIHLGRTLFTKEILEKELQFIDEIIKTSPNYKKERLLGILNTATNDILYKHWLNFDKTKLNKEILAKELIFIDKITQINPTHNKEKLLEIFGRAMIRKGSFKEKLKFFRNCGIPKKTIFKIAFKRILKKIKNLPHRIVVLLLKILYFHYIILHFIAFFTCRKDKMIFVTGADSSHYKSLGQFLTSFFKYEPNTKVIVYDLGLTEAENCNLCNSFPLAEVRIFDYSKHPNYFNIKKHANGNYAWKPIIIYNVFNEFKCNICWMDAGNIILRPLYLLRKEAKKSGFYSPFSDGNIAKWTHPATLRFLNVSKKLLKKRNLSSGCVTISYQNPKIRELITKWHGYTFIKECISPKGSSLANHRYDQAILIILAYQLNVFHHMPEEEYYGVKYHQDID